MVRTAFFLVLACLVGAGCLGTPADAPVLPKDATLRVTNEGDDHITVRIRLVDEKEVPLWSATWALDSGQSRRHTLVLDKPSTYAAVYKPEGPQSVVSEHEADETRSGIDLAVECPDDDAVRFTASILWSARPLGGGTFGQSDGWRCGPDEA